MPNCMTRNPEQAYEDLEERMEDPDLAFEVAEALLDEPSKEGLPDLRSKRAGKKRHPGFGRAPLAPLPGCKRNSSEKIRKIVSLRYMGYSDSAIERACKFSPAYVRQLESMHPKAFELAKQELIKNAVSEYEANVAFCRAALSEIGFQAVKTLSTVMNDTSAKQNVRLRAAETVMKLLMGATPGEKAIAEGVITKMGDFVQKVASVSRQSPSYIHDVDEIDEAEVVEDGETPALAG